MATLLVVVQLVAWHQALVTVMRLVTVGASSMRSDAAMLLQLQLLSLRRYMLCELHRAAEQLNCATAISMN